MRFLSDVAHNVSCVALWRRMLSDRSDNIEYRFPWRKGIYYWTCAYYRTLAQRDVIGPSVQIIIGRSCTRLSDDWLSDVRAGKFYRTIYLTRCYRTSAKSDEILSDEARFHEILSDYRVKKCYRTTKKILLSDYQKICYRTIQRNAYRTMHYRTQHYRTHDVKGYRTHVGPKLSDLCVFVIGPLVDKVIGPQHGEGYRTYKKTVIGPFMSG